MLKKGTLKLQLSRSLLPPYFSHLPILHQRLLAEENSPVVSFLSFLHLLAPRFQ
jgi:hypothetical protein